MIAYLKGELNDVEEEAIVLEVNGIGYNVKVNERTIQMLPALGSEMKIYTYTAVREDAVNLFGFLTKEDLEMFRLLITVSGIGPKGALAVLSVLDADGLRLAILSGDAKAIAKAQGVGAKTAERVIIDLKDKVSIEDTFVSRESNEAVMQGTAAGAVLKEAAEALTALGYPASEALRAVKQVENAEQMEVEELLKQALKKLF